MSQLMKIAAKHKPGRKRRSALDPHLEDLRRLREEGYSLEQITAFLAKLDVHVTKQAVHNFLKKNEEESSN